MMQEIAASGAGASGASAVHFYLFPPAPVIRYGSEEMKHESLPKLARGEILMAFGVTEATAGVDTSRITTRAEKVDGGWVVNGQKVWITNAQNAHKILQLGRTSPRNQDKPLDGMTAVVMIPAPKAMLKAFTVHWSVATSPPSDRWIAGSAVITTKPSSTTMKNATPVRRVVSGGDDAPSSIRVEAARVRLKARSSWWPSAAAARRRVGVEHGDGADLDSSAVP
jgi:Acyl-CoA dehydrogenase, middle domain/Acyl-CoA dehydrogenase, N-terminal domain